MSIFRILQLTDLHVFSDPAARLRGIPTAELLSDVVDYIRQSSTVFDAVVVTGDHTHDELPESYAAVRQLLNPWLDRLWQVPGNHDDRRTMREIFPDRIAGVAEEPIRFEFSVGDWLCLGLDTHVPGDVAGQIDGEQLDWAGDRIRKSDADAVALFMHHPPALIGSQWMDAIGLRGREIMRQWLDTEPRVKLVCCGHVHHEFSTRGRHAEIVTTPSTGIQFSPEGSQPTFVTAPPGFRIIELDGADFHSYVVRLPVARFSPE